ncbi:MAG: MarR family transcriptional regulator [Saprospiraceae bacterium]|nr:MarR family transcriptional regulator [Saprospiraceae bacterium]
MEIGKLIKQPKFSNSYHKAMLNLFYTSNYFRDAHLKVFSEYGIQGAHFNVLRILRGKHPEPLSPGSIKEVMLDKGCDLTRLIDKLVSLGWVVRNICPENKRKMNVTLTQEGSLITEKISIELTETDTALKTLTDEEYSTLSHLLDKMRG